MTSPVPNRTLQQAKEIVHNFVIASPYDLDCSDPACEALIEAIAVAIGGDSSPVADYREQASIVMFGADYDEVVIRNLVGNEYVNLVLDRITTALESAAKSAREAEQARIIDWLAHRCQFSPVCGNCTYCRVAKWIPL